MVCLYQSGTGGKVVTLLANDENIFALQNPEELFKDEWQYTGIESTSFGGEIKKFYKSFVEYTLTVSVVCDSQEDFANKIQNMSDVFQADIENKTPGKLYFNKTYLECFIRSSSYAEYDDLFYMADIELTVVSPYPGWISESLNTYCFGKDIDETSVLGFSVVGVAVLNTGKGASADKTINNSQLVPCDMSIMMFGPAESPLVQIGDNYYQVNYTIESGQTLTINTKSKTVTLGDGTNLFAYRNYDHNIFEKLQPGSNKIIYSEASWLFITKYESRGQPSWI